MLNALILSVVLVKFVVADTGEVLSQELIGPSDDVAANIYAQEALRRCDRCPLPLAMGTSACFIARFDSNTQDVTLTHVPNQGAMDDEEEKKPLFDLAELNKHRFPQSSFDLDENGRATKVHVNCPRGMSLTRHAQAVEEIEKNKFPTMPFKIEIRGESGVDRHPAIHIVDRDKSPVAITRSDDYLSYVPSVNNRGVLAWLRGDYAAAEAAFREALHDMPEYTPAQRNVNLLLRTKPTR